MIKEPQMPVKLYVDMLGDDKSFGFATNEAMMMKNAENLKDIIAKQNEDLDMIFAVGRFIGGIVMDKDSKVFMFFFDCKKDKTRANFICDNHLNENMRPKFMEVFKQVSTTYEAVYNDAVLVLDKNFPPDSIAN